MYSARWVPEDPISRTPAKPSRWPSRLSGAALEVWELRGSSAGDVERELASPLSFSLISIQRLSCAARSGLRAAIPEHLPHATGQRH